MVHLIHRKRAPLLHNLCDEGDGLVAVTTSHFVHTDRMALSRIIPLIDGTYCIHALPFLKHARIDL